MSRVKLCDGCNKEYNVMYRVQYKADRLWHFLCKSCVLEAKPNNHHYRYGGTWKG